METNNTKNHTGAELLIKFFEGSLTAESMSKEDYENLFKEVMAQEQPDGGVISFCSEGLNKYPEYRKAFHQKKLYRELVREHRMRTITQIITFFVPKTIKTTVAVSVFLIVTLFFSAVGVATAFGVNVFNFEYNLDGNKDTIGAISTVNREGEFYSIIQDVLMHEHDRDFIIHKYESINEINEAWFNVHISPNLDVADNFVEASYRLLNGKNFFTIGFEKEGHELTLTIQDSERETEIEHSKEHEKMTVGGIVFTIFKNYEEEDYNVIWERGYFHYHLYAPLPLKEVREIVQNYY